MLGQDADRNLLFGITALQNDFITRDALIAAMNAWAIAKHRPIGEILVEAKALDLGDRDALEAMIARRLAKHDNDPAASLAAISSAGSVAEDLRRSIADPDVLASIAYIPTDSQYDPHATRAPFDFETTDTTDFHRPAIRYRKVRDHAKGGLGIVYVALDSELKREVALKEIKPEYADNLGSQSRFLLEAEITGGLEHPGIVPVYGLGAYEDGRPFYAMRFIRGDSLKDAIAAFHADPSLKKDPGARTLALQKLLRRFLDVCNAVEYAHSRGVLHRDLKPDNVMVGRYGETLVVDWGLAKSVGRKDADNLGSLPESTVLSPSSGSAETLPGSVVGTPSYMSPEQASGRLDLLGPASDVYSLGATLYSLLTGQIPFADKQLTELLKKVERGEFPRLREHAPWLDPALEAVALKAMALKPSDRYDSPKGLAEDVERWLADEPVAAYPEPLARRAHRWARKHRTILTTATAATLVAALLIGGFVWQRSKERWRIDGEAIVFLDKSAQLAAKAEAGNSTLWEEAAGEADRAVDVLKAGGSPGQLHEATATVEALRAEARVIKTLEEARLAAANPRDGEWDNQAMIDGYFKAFQAYGIDVKELSIEEAARRIRSSRVADALITILDDWKQFSTSSAEGSPSHVREMKVPPERLLEIAGKSDSNPARIAIREAASRGNAAALRQLAQSKDDRRKLGPHIRFLFESLAFLDPKGSLPLLETILHENPDDFWFNYNLGLAYYQVIPKDPAKALHFLSIAKALRPGEPAVRDHLGFVLSDLGQLDRAVDEYEEAMRLYPNLTGGQSNLGNVQQKQGHLDRDVDEYEKAIRLSNLAGGHSNLGAALQKQGQLDRAIAELEEAIRLKPGLAAAHNNLGNVLHNQGHLDRAVAEYEAAVRLKPDNAYFHNNLGNTLRAQGQLDRAIAEFEAAIRIKPNLADAHLSYGNALKDQGHADRAITEFETTIQLNPLSVEGHFNLGNILQTQGHLDRAITEFETAIRLRPDLADAHCSLGLALLTIGKFREALESLEKGHALGSQQKGWRYPSETWVLNTRRLVELEAKLPALLKGETTPKDSAERLALADLCYKTGRYATSARFWGEAFAETPALADDLATGNRYNAACTASLAASGKGKDEPMPDDPAKAKLREQVLGWLRADLAAWGKLLDVRNEPAIKQAAVGTLAHWKEDSDLSGIHDEASLAKLPEAEREAFRKLWAEVEALRLKAGGGK